MLKRKLLNIIVLLLIIIIHYSCASNKVYIDRTAEGKISWPGPPERPRISYLWSLSNLAGSESSMVSLFVGKRENSPDPRDAETLLRPYGLFVDETGRLYITDTGAFRVSVVDLNTGESFNITRTVDGEFLSPIGVLRVDNFILVSDSRLLKVYKFALDGKPVGVFAEGFIRPTCMAFDKKNKKIYISDTLAHKVYIYNTEGKRIGSIGHRGKGDGEFNFPTHLWVDKDGNLYVTDSMNFRIQVFSSDGKFLFKFGKLGEAYGHLEKPKGVATDSDGNIYVADSIKDTIKIFNREGKLLLFFGEKGTYYGDFWLPSGIFIAKDYIYVADTYNGRVQVFKYLGSGNNEKGVKK